MLGGAEFSGAAGSAALEGLPSPGGDPGSVEEVVQLDPELPAGEALRNLIADRPEKAVEMLSTWLEEQPVVTDEPRQRENEPA